MDTREFNEIIAANSSWISALRTEVGKVVIGQQALVDRLILSLLCKGHVRCMHSLPASSLRRIFFRRICWAQ